MAQETIILDSQGMAVRFHAVNLVAITKSDTEIFPQGTLFVGTGGDLYVKCRGNSSFVVLKNIPNGTFLPIECIAVGASSTASDFVMCY
jgi:hypothetical protein